MFKRLFLLLLLLFLVPSGVFAQERKDRLMGYIIENGDTIYVASIREAFIIGHFSVKNKRDWREYRRMVYNFKKVYPYSQIAKNKLAEMDTHFAQLKTKKERKNYIDKVEKEMFAEFEGPLRKLTKSQGKMLIKLIDCETGRSSFAVVKELKGGFKTFFWQNIGKLFGYNLKTRYDPTGEDAVLEELVQMYKNGSFDYLYYRMFPFEE
ncbi:MAG: DUF4294 domain-containing protein [Prevotellaceae bacterium]|jgi:hypothetical protein|nr:DUF4294 domain-containing protein [Prevotellaceae bacterium]